MPLVVTVLAIRAHLRDVREGRPTFLWAFIKDPTSGDGFSAPGSRISARSSSSLACSTPSTRSWSCGRSIPGSCSSWPWCAPSCRISWSEARSRASRAAESEMGRASHPDPTCQSQRLHQTALSTDGTTTHEQFPSRQDPLARARSRDCAGSRRPTSRARSRRA